MSESHSHESSVTREPTHQLFARNWRNGWLQDGCPEHSCAEHRVQLEHMLYAVCGVCGDVEGE